MTLKHFRLNFKGDSKDDVIKELYELTKKHKKLKRKYGKLEEEFQKYKNPDTPSSSNKHLKPNTSGLRNKNGSKRGAPKGHTGTNRHQTTDEKEDVDATECPVCNSTNVEDEKIITQTTEEIEDPVTPKTKESKIHLKHCRDCNLNFIPPQNTTPLNGKFGINLMVLVIFIKFILRGVLRKTVSFLDTGFAFKITPASVNSIIKRVAQAAEKEYATLKQKIRTSSEVYVDETSFSVLGKNWWVWAFRTSDSVLLVVRPSRGSNVLEEILGKLYSGTVICDCWRAYNFLSFANIQRCWAHLLRKSKDLCSTVAGKHLHQKLKALFEEIKVFNVNNPTDKQRKEKYNELTSELKKLTDYYSRYEDFKGIITYLNGNLENWFTCVKVEGIEPTNNFAERAIRETVMVRKIIGAFRSETGTQNYETLASVISTWQIKGLEWKKELKQMLIKNLCFC
jgi:transposase